MFKVLSFVICVLVFICHLSFGICHFLFAAEQAASEADQQINEFSLVGFGEKGKKSWDLSGKSADIFGQLIKLQDVVGNMYGKEEDIKITADKGDFDKTEGKVHLEQNVVITTSSGSKLTTESLDWDRKNKLVTTEEVVNITKENMTTVARGAQGEPNLNKVTLRKDVQVDILPQTKEGKTKDEKGKIIITCDGPLEIDYAKNVAVFKNNVKVDTQDNLMYSDTMDVYFLAAKDGPEAKPQENPENSPMLMGAKIEKIVGRGNVKIIKGENISYSEEVTYTSFDKKIVLTGRPKLVIYSTEDMDASFGN
ncbi:MAG: LPS export ABC transporter periplasmic protein LptC [Omnitrophica WOR_2 bacterium RIFCSPLOWO2_01_FULL_41_12]|nr:MAG: LPS export ABC transporter periplasmic protein LptC [Omnitrophica WOR_2 bacterium RIFCSPLOWO2_01_FULL_41_12]